MTKNVKERAAFAHTSVALRDYLCERNEWTAEDFEAIDWTGMRRALDSETHDFWVRIVKLQHDWLGVGAQRAKICSSTTDECPCCGQPGERTLHLLTCRAKVMCGSKWLALEEFKKFVEPVFTSPLIMHTLMKAIRAVMEGESTVRFRLPQTAVRRILRRAVNEQTEIGWSHLLKGGMSKHWRRAQEMYYAERHRDSKTLSGGRWLVWVTRGLWRIYDRQWRTRNECLHDVASGLNRRELRARIAEMYRNPHLWVAAEDISLFRLPV